MEFKPENQHERVQFQRRLGRLYPGSIIKRDYLANITDKDRDSMNSVQYAEQSRKGMYREQSGISGEFIKVEVKKSQI